MKARTGAMEARPEAMKARPACPEAMEAAPCSLTYDLKREGVFSFKFGKRGLKLNLNIHILR